MATSEEYARFVCEQLSGFGAIRSRKMFGEYVVYLNDKPILSVCDNIVYVKKLPVIAALMQNAACGVPYPSAKEHYILDIDNTELLHMLIPQLEAAASVPKPRKQRT